MNDPLKGKDLVDYLEAHRNEYEGNGDSLCVAAGYGKDSDDGSTQCNLPALVKELGDATDLSSYETDDGDDGKDWET